MNDSDKKNQTFIIKATGEKQIFDPLKLINSLKNSGATDETANDIAHQIESELIVINKSKNKNNIPSTNEIYDKAFSLLHQKSNYMAARYSIKKAIADLGPNGFPFEKFIAEIFKSNGYEAVTNQIVQGDCVEHEMDVIAWKNDELIMVEAKFHNETGLKSDLKVVLYMNSRFDDLKNQEFDYGGKKRKMTKGLLITNTKFTDHAIQYAECKGLPVIGWSYPKKDNLESMIGKSGLHPLTSLTTLSGLEKKSLLDAGFVLCKHVFEQKDNLSKFNINKEKIPSIIEEINYLCSQ